MSIYELKEIERPVKRGMRIPIALSDDTMKERAKKVFKKMHECKLNALVIYGDLEHGSNFEYLTGFLPRFEEALLVLHSNEEAYLLLGNENLKMAAYSRIAARPIHVPFFSLPNQPMLDDMPIQEYLRKAGLSSGKKTGLIGWKMFTSTVLDNRMLIELPYYLVTAVKQVVGDENVENSSHLFICGEDGVRTVNNANEIAHYEYGAALAGDCIFNAMDHVLPGKKEFEIGNYLNVFGQKNSVITIAATGKRFEKANLYPSEKQIKIGDKISLTVGYKGGLTSRAGYVVTSEKELPSKEQGYIKELAGPYFLAVVEWLESISIGMCGDDLYRKIQKVLPQEEFNWTLNPGHLIGDEEWMASPIYPGSKEILKSGMMLQIDIIPSRPGYGGCGCESGIVLADALLRKEIEQQYPALYNIFTERRKYMQEVLHIHISEDVLPMSDTVAYYRPFFLNRRLAFVKKEKTQKVG